MERSISDRTIIDKFVEDFVKIVEKHVKYIIVSGYVAISHGRSRGTEDVDMIIDKILEKEFVKLHEDLIKVGFECIQSGNVDDVYDYLERGDSIRYVRKGEHLPEMEVKFVKDEIDILQLATRRKFPFTGLDCWFSSIEMNIAFKEELLKSEKDLDDADHLRIVYHDELNEHLIGDIKKMIRRLRLKKNG